MFRKADVKHTVDNVSEPINAVRKRPISIIKGLGHHLGARLHPRVDQGSVDTIIIIEYAPHCADLSGRKAISLVGCVRGAKQGLGSEMTKCGIFDDTINHSIDTITLI